MTSVPGAGRGRRWLAKSTNACDTAGMRPLSRALARWDPIRVAAAFFGVAILLLLGAYGFAATTTTPTAGSIVAALALAGIAGSGLLYAWRPGAGGIVD